MKRENRSIVVLSILIIAVQVSTSPAADVTVVTTFPADNGPGYKAIPDTQGAAGPNHVVDFDALNFVVHDRPSPRGFRSVESTRI